MKVGWVCGRCVNNYFWWDPNGRGIAPVEWFISTQDRYAWPVFHDRCQIDRSMLRSRSPYWQRNERPPGRWMGNFPQRVCCPVQVWQWTWTRTDVRMGWRLRMSNRNRCLSMRLRNKMPQILESSWFWGVREWDEGDMTKAAPRASIIWASSRNVCSPDFLPEFSSQIQGGTSYFGCSAGHWGLGLQS